MIWSIGADSDVSWRRVFMWALVALLLWLGARAAERDTLVGVFSDGGRLRVEVGGSTLSAAMTVESVERIEIRAMDSVFPPGGRSIEISQRDGARFADPLPSRFDIPAGEVMPLGDWEIDERAGHGVVYSREVGVRGPFTLRATFRGRVHHEMTLSFHGQPGFSVGFRRGLINNDLFIRNREGDALGATSIDPDPGADLLSAASLLGHGAAAAALLIAVFLLVARLLPQAPIGRGSTAELPRSVAVISIALLVVAATLVSLWLATDVLEGLPHVPDSVVYLLQADWLTTGSLWQESSPIQEHLTIPFTYVLGNRWVAHYPFGWPMLLSAGVALGRPWVIAPLLGGLYLLLLFLVGRELFSRGLGLTAAALAAVSPMSRLIFASQLAHAASSTFTLAFLWLLLVARRRSGSWPALLAGLALGSAFGIRPITALAMAVPCGILLLDDFRRQESDGPALRILVATAVGGIVAAIPVLLQNAAITGKLLSFPYSLAHGTMYGLDNLAFGVRNMDALLASTVPALFGWGWGFSSTWLFQALPFAFAWVPFLLRRAAREDLLLAACFTSLALVHLGTRADGLHGFGPRYYFDGFFCLYLLTARGFQELTRIAAEPLIAGQRENRPAAPAVTAALAAILFLALNLPAAGMLSERLGLYRGYNLVDGSLERAIEEQGVDRALVLFTEDYWQDWAMASRLMHAKPANGLIFAQSLEDNSALWAAYPDRPVYSWSEAGLERLDRP